MSRPATLWTRRLKACDSVFSQSNDVLSASLGAFCCTSFFYAGGQDGWEVRVILLFMFQ